MNRDKEQPLQAGMVREPKRADWMHQGSFGLMVHHIVRPDGNNDKQRKEDMDRIVDRFDLNLFLEQFDATGADWLIFTIGQNSGYYSSPNRYLDTVLPGHTSSRDLVLEVARAIKYRGKRFVAYLPAEVEQQSNSIKRAFLWDPSDYSKFQQRYAEFLRDYSLSLGTHADGWWLDGCWIHPERFGDWQGWMKALRAGNPDSAVAVSPGPSQKPMTPLQDYLAGETYELPAPVPSSQFVDGVQWHALLPLDCSFTGGSPNSYSDETLFGWVLECKKAGGAVTLNLEIDYDGAIPRRSVAQLERLAVKLKSSSTTDDTV